MEERAEGGAEAGGKRVMDNTLDGPPPRGRDMVLRACFRKTPGTRGCGGPGLGAGPSTMEGKGGTSEGREDFKLNSLL